nr:hypothetical protein [Tanacetum cinerariifolium]
MASESSSHSQQPKQLTPTQNIHFEVEDGKYRNEIDHLHSLSHFDKPPSFDLDVFSTVTGLERSEDFVLIPPKEAVKAGLATLGLTDENHTSLSSSDLINLSQTPPEVEKQSCTSLLLDLIAQKGYTDERDEYHQHPYINENLENLKPHHITALSFKPTLENETALTTCMCKVDELSPDPIKSSLLPSREVNADDSADKSSFGTFVQPVIQPKAPTDLKPKKKRISPSSKPKSSKQVMDVPQKKQVAKTQPAEETVAIADATQSLGASESTEDQRMKEPTDSDLHSIPDDEVVSISGFRTDDSNEERTEFTKPKSSNPLGHLRKEISSLSTQEEQPPKNNIMENAQGSIHLYKNYQVLNKLFELLKTQIKLPVSEPAQTTSSALVVHTLEEKASDNKASEEEPSPKRMKFLISNPRTKSPTSRAQSCLKT